MDAGARSAEDLLDNLHMCVEHLRIRECAGAAGVLRVGSQHGDTMHACPATRGEHHKSAP